MTASAALLLVLGSTVGCTKLKARDQLVRGVQAFKSGKYEEAVDYFQKSVALNPSDPTTHLYLATAYSYQVVPDLTTPENLAIAQKALDGFNTVLAEKPNDLDALRQIASIDRNIHKYDEAKATELKLSRSIPKMPKRTTPSATSTGLRPIRTPPTSSPPPVSRMMVRAM
jgi:tetratricopeptide (TPR) repeat protein